MTPQQRTATREALFVLTQTFRAEWLRYRQCAAPLLGWDVPDYTNYRARFRRRARRAIATIRALREACRVNQIIG